MNLKKIALIVAGAMCALATSSCSVCSRTAAADFGRSADVILLPLEKPTLCQVDKDWYMCGQKAWVERHNAPWVNPDQLPAEKRHPERYTLVDEEFTPMYARIPENLANSIKSGHYTHSDAISFINRKWVSTLPEGTVKRVKTTAEAPAFFRNMSSHRLLKSEQGSSYLIARIGEMSADFSAIYAYPFAGLCAIIIDTPASFFYSPPNQKVIQKAEAEEVE